MSKFKFIHKQRQQFFDEHKNEDSAVILCQSSQVLLSCPHGVSQVRNGIKKVSEIGSSTLTLELQKRTGANAIFKTQNNFDDANFDANCPYKQRVLDIVDANKIKYCLDFHGLKSTRELDVNLGTNIGFNLGEDEDCFNILEKILQSAGFVVTVDMPFKGGLNTISNFVHKKTGIFSLQIEVNSGITNKEANFKKFEKLVECLKKFVNYLEKSKK